jgi:hypothetical protein
MKHEHPLEYERITGESLGHSHAKETKEVKQENG